jgi:hypothetical protein
VSGGGERRDLATGDGEVDGEVLGDLAHAERPVHVE